MSKSADTSNWCFVLQTLVNWCFALQTLANWCLALQTLATDVLLADTDNWCPALQTLATDALLCRHCQLMPCFADTGNWCLAVQTLTTDYLLCRHLTTDDLLCRLTQRVVELVYARVTDCVFKGREFTPRARTTRTETSFRSRVVRNSRDPCSEPLIWWKKNLRRWSFRLLSWTATTVKKLYTKTKKLVNRYLALLILAPTEIRPTDTWMNGRSAELTVVNKG